MDDAGLDALDEDSGLDSAEQTTDVWQAVAWVAESDAALLIQAGASVLLDISENEGSRSNTKHYECAAIMTCVCAVICVCAILCLQAVQLEGARAVAHARGVSAMTGCFRLALAV